MDDGSAGEGRGGGLGIEPHALRDSAQDIVIRDGEALVEVGGEQPLSELRLAPELRASDDEMLLSFREAARALEIRVAERDLSFPSTRVVLARGSLEQFSRSIEAVDSIAELRRAKTVPSIFMEMPRWELAAFADDLLHRTTPPHEHAPSICILDTGVTQGHPLIRIVMDEADLHAVDDQWQTNDHDGHGDVNAFREGADRKSIPGLAGIAHLFCLNA